MEHVAIMKGSWGLTQKIPTGEKTIESRWYKVRCRPWGRIKAGDTVYFKDSGRPVSVKAKVRKVVQHSCLGPKKVREILKEYGKEDGLGIGDIPKFYRMFRDKRYCMLIFLEDPRKVKPFNIDKAGFGTMSAWLTVDNVARIKR